MSVKRWVLEGTWSGYTSAQSHVVHREVVTNVKRIERLKQLHTILYTDGTTLNLHLREAKPHERVVEKHGYSSLIRDAEKMKGSFIRVVDIVG